MTTVTPRGTQSLVFLDFTERHEPSSLLLRHAGDLPLNTLADILRRASARNIYTVLDNQPALLADDAGFAIKFSLAAQSSAVFIPSAKSICG